MGGILKLGCLYTAFRVQGRYGRLRIVPLLSLYENLSKDPNAQCVHPKRYRICWAPDPQIMATGARFD